MKKLNQIKITIAVNGELKIIWVTLGDTVDYTKLRFAIDNAWDAVDDRHNKPLKKKN